MLNYKKIILRNLKKGEFNKIKVSKEIDNRKV